MMQEHFMQSPEWERLVQNEGYKTRRVTGEGFEAMMIRKSTPVGIYLFCPYGPTVKDRGAFLRATEVLKKAVAEEKAVFVRIEPVLPLIEGDSEKENVLTIDFMRKNGYVKSHDIDPAHTWVIDLTRSKEEILADIEKDRVRAWRNIGKRGVKFRKTQEPEEVGALATLLKQLGEVRHFSPQDEEHLRRQLKAGFATLYIAEIEEDGKKKVIAATLMDDYKGIRFATHAAADEAYRRFKVGPCLTVQAMMDAKDAGMTTFDFWGMTPSEDPKHPWYGFTQYKKSFGGRQVDYAGTWDLPVDKMKYKVYRWLRKINKKVRRIRR